MRMNNNVQIKFVALYTVILLDNTNLFKIRILQVSLLEMHTKTLSLTLKEIYRNCYNYETTTVPLRWKRTQFCNDIFSLSVVKS